MRLSLLPLAFIPLLVSAQVHIRLGITLLLYLTTLFRALQMHHKMLCSRRPCSQLYRLALDE